MPNKSKNNDPKQKSPEVDLFVYLCGQNTPEYTYSVVEDLSETLIVRMRSFINETSFDVAAFEPQVSLLEKKLSIIEHILGDLLPCKNEVTNRFGFAKEMLAVLKRSATVLIFQTSSNSQDIIALQRVIQIHVLLFNLYDSYGDPAFREEGYAQSVRRYISLLNSWVEAFRKLQDKSPDVIQMFEFHMNEVEYILRILESHIVS
ncbi:hypothetical protein JCM33374_g1875 [Metschnikowia sp. JCM 33374]|nr:hypothetical protein JCM33374_g1875 [Metschnikowia sp. JCM 33374]